MSPDDDRPAAPRALAETRLRAEIARERRREEAQMKTLRAGCVAIIGLLLLGMALVFYFA